MKKKISLILIALLLVLALATCMVACDPETPEPTPDPTPEPGPTMYTVTIDLQDGTTPTTQQVAEGNTVVFPSVSGNSYKTFKGWFLNADGTGLWSKSKPVTENITIYACWNLRYAGITYNLNYADAPVLEKEYQPLGNVIALPTPPTRDYWVFDGWFTDKACTKALDTSMILTKDITLYAQWSLDPNHTHEYTAFVTPENCTEDGYTTYTCACTTTYTADIVPAYGHSFTFDATNYLSMVTCNNENCEHAERKPSELIYKDKFVFDFDAEKQAEIDGRYAAMIEILNGADAYDAALHGYEKDSELYTENQAFEAIFNAFYDDLMYLVEQYQYAYVFYNVEASAKNTTAFETISKYRTEKISEFYSLYRLIYESKFREYFFDMSEGGWTEEDIEAALILSDSYGGDEYASLNTRISEIEIEFEAIKNQDTSARVLELYEEFVSLNNQIAQLAGYNNYPEYAYPNVYGRDYSPAEVATMRNYVKQYLKDAYLSLYNGYYNSMTSGGVLQGTIESQYYNALTEDSIFDSKLTSDLVQSYFEVMNSTTAGETEIDFFAHANDLFKNGNYYVGSTDGAFSYWIPAQDTSILYFGPDSYRGAFTFVHEFGHYYNNVYNPNVSMTLDLDEVHSQGNEMMFLSYLETKLPKGVLRKIYDKIYYDNVFNMFAIIMLATAVDEFEYCVYTNTTPSGEPTTYVAKDYDNLFIEIMRSYGIADTLKTSYWRYVTISSPCYYISYAMSALPCIELLSIADTEGFETARAKYLKFFTFTDDETIVSVDEYGDKVVNITYAQTLEFVGLNSVFAEQLYSSLNNYFCNIEKDFTYAS